MRLTSRSASPAAPSLPDTAAEYRFRAPDETLLRSIASATGGTWHPTAATLANTAADSRTARRPLWPWLVALALVLWFVDFLLRRVRIFEPKLARSVRPSEPASAAGQIALKRRTRTFSESYLPLPSASRLLITSSSVHRVARRPRSYSPDL